MHYSFIKYLVSGAWMIDPLTMTSLSGIVQGILSGQHFEKNEPIPFSSTHFVNASKNSNSSDEKEIHVISLSGVMTKHDQFCGPVGARTIANSLLTADKNPNIIGHLFVIESGGGEARAVPELASAIAQLQKPIVGFIDGIACSAAIYAISYCNYVFAHHAQDMIGCVGTMIELTDFPKSSTLQDGRIKVRLYADPSNEKNQDFEEALEGKFDLIKSNLLNPLAKTFRDDMKRLRPNAKDEHLKGKTFFASDVEGILFDKIGSFDDAISKVIELSEETTYKNSNISQTNKTTMKDLPLLLAVLALTEIEVQDGHVSLSVENLKTIESTFSKFTSDLAAQTKKLTDSVEKATQLETDLNAANADIATKKTRIETLEKAIDDASDKGAEETAETKKTITDASNSIEDSVRNHLKKYN